MHNMSSGDDDDGQKNVAVKWVAVGGRRTSFAILMRHFVVHLRRHIRFNSPASSLSTYTASPVDHCFEGGWAASGILCGSVTIIICKLKQNTFSGTTK